MSINPRLTSNQANFSLAGTSSFHLARGTCVLTNSACFSYLANVSPSGPGTNTACFSYSADAPSSSGNRGAAQPAMPGLRRMPATYCFSYPATWCFVYPSDVPPGTQHRDAVPSAPPDSRQMPAGTCFRY